MNKRLLISTTSLGILSILAVVYYALSTPQRQLDDNFSHIKKVLALSTTKNPEIFTEMYFEDHTKLPKKINQKHIGEKYKFKFSIRNLENQDMDYKYRIYSISEGTKTVTEENSVSVKLGQVKTIEGSTGILVPIRTQVVVELTDTNQSISFWMDADNPISDNSLKI